MDTQLAELLRAWTNDQSPPLEGSPERSSSASIPLASSFGAPGSERPGEYPYTRGVTSRGYLGNLWVMGQYSGYASPRETNQRFKDLLQAGQTGFSIALDLPTQLGLDSDDPLSEGEVGKVGIPLDTADDLILLLDGIPFERVRQIRTSANAIGPIFLAFMLVALEELGVPASTFRLMLQNDPLKEFPARGTFIFPPAPSLKLAVDVVEYCAVHQPRWEPIEFSGYHIRDSGGTAVHEVAIATANGIAYLDEAIRRGVDIESITHSLFIFLSTSLDIFEEAAKLRAARRLWAHLLHERYGVRKEHAGINIFIYTLGGTLTVQEPLNNVIRVAYEALAAVLGGAQTVATSSFDEAIGLPSKEAAHLALRTQQILAYETGVTKVVDPLGGSYYVEYLTDALEKAIRDCLLTITELGGAVAAVESGFVQQALADSAYQLQREVESGKRPVVGVNIFPGERTGVTSSIRVREDIHLEQRDRLSEVRAQRNQKAVRDTLANVHAAALNNRNTVPSIIEAARHRATIGEIVNVLSNVYGHYQSGGVFI